MDRLLTTQEAAQKAGVGPTAIKRWADAGLLPCVRTAGGHRRFREVELATFLARANGAEVASDGEVDRWLESVLLAESGQEVEAQVLRLRGQHGAWHRAASFLGDVLVEIGARWARGDLSIIEEHLVSERLLRAFIRIGESMPVQPDGPVALLTTVEGEEHLLGLALVELCLREAGLRTRWSGRSTPVEEVVAFLERGGAEIIAVSASATINDRAQLEAWLARVIPACVAANVELVLGGEGPWPEPVPFGVRMRSFSELRAFLVGRQSRTSDARPRSP